jgi:hypothetical protein
MRGLLANEPEAYNWVHDVVRPHIAALTEARLTAEAERDEARQANRVDAENIKKLVDATAKYEAENANLRRSIIKAGRAAGCLLSDDVSNDFLSHVHEQVEGRMAENAKLREALADACESTPGWRKPAMDLLAPSPPEPIRTMFICAQWKRLSDGCDVRCDKDDGHEGRHIDSVLGIGWDAAPPESESVHP